MPSSWVQNVQDKKERHASAMALPKVSHHMDSDVIKEQCPACGQEDYKIHSDGYRECLHCGRLFLLARSMARIGPALKKIRERNGLTVRGVAMAIGVARSTLWEWEAGRVCPRDRNIRKLIKFYRSIRVI